MKSEDAPYPKRFFIRLILLAVLLWTATWVLLLWLLPDFESRGLFGDMFGAVNSLFSGLALAGIVYTVLLQQEEMKRQRIESRENEEARRLQMELFSRQLAAMQAQTEALGEQLNLTRQTALPAFHWRGASGVGREKTFNFENKGGRVKLTKIVSLNNQRVTGTVWPGGFLQGGERGKITFTGDTESDVSPLLVRFELHYETMHGPDYKVFEISNGKHPVEAE